MDPLFLVWLVARSTEDLLDTVLTPVGLTSDEFAIYSVLAAEPGIAPSELSRWMAAPRTTTVSSYVKRLEADWAPHPRGEPGRSTLVWTAPHTRESARSNASRRIFAPVRAQVIEALGAMEAPVRENLMRLRAIVDALRAADASLVQGGEHLGDEAPVGGARLGGVRAERGADDDEVIEPEGDQLEEARAAPVGRPEDREPVGELGRELLGLR